VSAKIALCLPGGGASGAIFQIGALAALEDTLEGADAGGFALYVGSSGGASVAAALAGGLPVQRIYRAFLDPADVYFGLERKHLLRFDLGEWRRVLPLFIGALGEGATGLLARGTVPPPSALWEKLEKLAEALPAGLFTLDAYEKFLEDFFIRRGVPNSFYSMKRPLRILAHELDTAELTLFGSESAASAPVTRACTASMAIPPFFSPVKIDERYYMNPGAGQVVHVEVAVADGADVLVVINPLVPFRAPGPRSSAEGSGLRDRGMLAIINQAMRVGAWRSLRDQSRRAGEQGKSVLFIEPDLGEGAVLLGNPASMEVRRRILEYAYRHTRAVLVRAFEEGHEAFRRANWLVRPPRSSPLSTPVAT
jgi:predicted acylesterase/phospholipase RssA